MDGDDGLVQWCDVRYNHGHGVGGNGDRVRSARTEIHHQMQMGTGGEGANCTGRTSRSTTTTATRATCGAGRRRDQVGVQRAGSHPADRSHDNTGHGLWCDINNGRVVATRAAAMSTTTRGTGSSTRSAWRGHRRVTSLKTEIRDCCQLRHRPGIDQWVLHRGPDRGVGVTVMSRCRAPLHRPGRDGPRWAGQLRTDHNRPRQPPAAGPEHGRLRHQVVWPGSGFCNGTGIRTDDPPRPTGSTPARTTTSRATTTPSRRPGGTGPGSTTSGLRGVAGPRHDDTGTRTIGGTVTIPRGTDLDTGPHR